MPVEKANYISDLVPTNPQLGDNIADGPDHFWLIKKAIQNTFPNIKGAITASQDQLNTLTGLVGASTSDGMDLKGSLTVSDGMDLKGSLTVSDGMDLKGNLTVEGEALVPSVTDWTKKQAVPASDADARYVQPAMLPFTDRKMRFQIIKIGDSDGWGIPIPQSFSGPPAFVSACRGEFYDGYYTKENGQATITLDESLTTNSKLHFNIVNSDGDYVTVYNLYIMVGGYF